MPLRTVAVVSLWLLSALPQATSAAPRDATSTGTRCAADAAWDEPSPPRRLFDSAWYVGTCGISAVLIATPAGHVLIDGGTEQGGELVAANIRALGFELKDVKYILTSHEHFDHVGGVAFLQRASGATVLARGPAATALAAGRNDRDDPQAGVLKPFPAVANVSTIPDGHRFALGGIEFSAHATPGHAPGSTSWTWESCEGDVCARIAYVDSVSAVSDDVFRYSDEAAHPGYLAAFRHSLDLIAELPCNLIVTPHPSASALWDRVGPGATQALLDDGACRRYAVQARTNLDARIVKERTATGNGATP